MTAQPPPTPEPVPGTPLAAPTAAAPKRRTAFVAAVTVGTLAVVGGGAFAAFQVLKGGPSAEQALPSTVLASMTIDLNPSAGQKVEAIKTLRKFPQFRDDVDVDSGDDLRKKLFEEAIPEDCDLSYADDVEPWIGDNAGIAAMDVSGEPVPLVAVAVTDEDKAADGLNALGECGSDEFGYGFVNGFALVSDSQSHADKAVKDATAKPLADDEAYQRWSDKAGDRGVLNFYVAKAAGEFLRDQMNTLSPSAGASAPTAAADPFKDFEGAAGAVRFADGGMEVEVVGNAAKGSDSTVAGDLATRLPADTAAVFGFSVPEGYADQVVDQIDQLGALFGGSSGLSAEFEQELGLDLPDDLRTLLGTGMTLSVGGTPPANLDTLESPADQPVGLTISGDEKGIGDVITKIIEGVGDSGDLLSGFTIDTDTEGRAYAAFNGDYVDELEKGGDLAGDDTFSSVVREADKAAFIAYVDLNSEWRTAIGDTMSGEEKQEFLDNTEPLEAAGLSVWRDGDESRFLLKVTTD